jgi:hypothetical protein
MSKVTAVTDAQGQIVVIGHGHLSEATAKKSGLKGARAVCGRFPASNSMNSTCGKCGGDQGLQELHDKVRPHLEAKP